MTKKVSLKTLSIPTAKHFDEDNTLCDMSDNNGSKNVKRNKGNRTSEGIKVKTREKKTKANELLFDQCSSIYQCNKSANRRTIDEIEDLWTKTKPEMNENENSQGTSRAEISSKHSLPNLDSNVVSSKQLKGETKQKVQKNENYECKTKPFFQNFPNKKKE